MRRILHLEGMPQRTARTLADPAELLRQLRVVRTRGFALDDGENEEGGRCIAVPLRGIGIPCAISLSAPALRFSLDSVEDVASELLRVAAGLERELAETND